MRSLRLLPALALLVGVNLLLLRDGFMQTLPTRAPAPATDATTIPRCVVLVFDGVDWNLLREYMADGALPHLAAVAEEGAARPLRSEDPPESPVALASMQTGVNPGRHGIFDFVVPGEDYVPDNGMVSVRRPRLLLGRVPVRPPRIRSRLAFPTFQERVRLAGYPVLSLQQPLLFPVPDAPGSLMTSGLGTPDVAGSAGFYTVYSDRVGTVEGPTTFGGWRLPLVPGERGGVYETVLLGPQDPTAGADAFGGSPRVTLPLRFERVQAGDEERVRIEVAGQEEVVRAGERSGFFRVTFHVPIWPVRRAVNGLARFEVKSLSPLVVLCDPVCMDPLAPPFPLSTPGAFSAELAHVYGLAETQGWTEQTFQVNDRNQDDRSFLRDLLQDMDRSAAALLGEMKRRDARLVFITITGTDRAAHVFWRYRDKNHPIHASDPDFEGGDPLRAVYRRMDDIVGRVRGVLGPDDLLLVASDHGFTTWRWQVHVNQWLVDNGYMSLQHAARAKNLHGFFGGKGADLGVDWSKTRAYAMGLGQVYLNRAGRDPQGIVSDADAPALIEELRRGLLALENPYLTAEDRADGVPARPIQRVLELATLYGGPLRHAAPDLQLAFAPGYRISWQTALLGGMRAMGEVFETNEVPWSGDHCSCDPAVVPGILVVNRPLPEAPADRPYHVRDVCATVLRHFGIDLACLEGDAAPLPLGSGR